MILEGIIAGVVVFFAMLGIMILFVDDLDLRLFLGVILISVALGVGFFYFGGVLFIAGCVAVAVIAALIADKVVENLSLL